MSTKSKKAVAKTKSVKSPVKKSAGKVTATKKPKAVKATTAKKAAPKKTTMKKSPAKKITAKKTVAKKAPAKKAAAKKAPTKKVQAKKMQERKTTIPKKITTKKIAPKKIAAEKKVASVKKVEAMVKPAIVKTIKPVEQVKKPDLKIVISNVQKLAVVKEEKAAKKPTPITKSKLTTLKSIRNIMVDQEVKPIKPSTAGLYGVPPYIEKAGEDYMNEAHKAHFREILYRWKRELMEEVDRTKSHMQDGVLRHPDPSDNATQEEEFNLELRTRDRERKLIKKIDEALERIDGDEYGYCDACGVEIGIRRLEARPTAEMCVDCKTLDEIKERQTRG